MSKETEAYGKEAHACGERDVHVLAYLTYMHWQTYVPRTCTRIPMCPGLPSVRMRGMCGGEYGFWWWRCGA